MMQKKNTLDLIVEHLQVPQKIYEPPIPEEPECYPFPVEFRYFGRCLHRLGNNFNNFKIVDVKIPLFVNSLIYAITGGKKQSMEGSTLLNNQEYCNLLGVNVLMVGPDEQKYTRLISSSFRNSKYSSEDQPYVILFRSYENNYYPIVTLDEQDSYLFYPYNNSILQKLLPKE